MEQVPSLGLPSQSRVLNQVDPILTLGQYWLGAPKKVQVGLGNVVEPLVALQKELIT